MYSWNKYSLGAALLYALCYFVAPNRDDHTSTACSGDYSFVSGVYQPLPTPGHYHVHRLDSVCGLSPVYNTLEVSDDGRLEYGWGKVDGWGVYGTISSVGSDMSIGGECFYEEHRYQRLSSDAFGMIQYEYQHGERHLSSYRRLALRCTPDRPCDRQQDHFNQLPLTIDLPATVNYGGGSLEVPFTDYEVYIGRNRLDTARFQVAYDWGDTLGTLAKCVELKDDFFTPQDSSTVQSVVVLYADRNAPDSLRRRVYQEIVAAGLLYREVHRSFDTEEDFELYGGPVLRVNVDSTVAL